MNDKERLKWAFEQSGTFFNFSRHCEAAASDAAIESIRAPR